MLGAALVALAALVSASCSSAGAGRPEIVRESGVAPGFGAGRPEIVRESGAAPGVGAGRPEIAPGPGTASAVGAGRPEIAPGPGTASAVGAGRSEITPAPGAVPAIAGRAHRSAFFDAATFAAARSRAGASRPVSGARAVIVPHHWVAGHLIVAGVRDLVAGAGGRVERVVVIGPNHIGAGGAPVTTSDQAWSTPLGRVEPDREAVAALAAAGVAVPAPAVLTDEHSLAGIMPVLATFAPRARVLPLAVRPGLRLDEAQRLAGTLVLLLRDPGTVLVASIDFSHYLTPDAARAYDRESIDVLHRLDAGAAITFSDEHFDSPGSVATLLLAMRATGAGRFVLRAHTSSAEILGPSPAGTTSYVSGFFTAPQGGPSAAAAVVAQNDADPAGARSTR